MEIVEKIFEWLDIAGQVATIGMGVFLTAIGFSMKKWSRVVFMVAGLIMLLSFLSWAFHGTLLFAFFQKTKIAGQIMAVIVAVISVILGKWDGGFWGKFFLIAGILMLMPLANFIFKFILILLSLLLC